MAKCVILQGYPPLPSHATTRKTSGSGSSGRSFPASPSVEDRLKALTLDILKGNPSRIHDSGYMSHTSASHVVNHLWGNNTSTDSSMHTVEARLQPHGGQGQLLVNLSEKFGSNINQITNFRFESL